MNRVLLVVDVQRDFCEGGALAVPGANEIIPIVNKLAESAEAAGLHVFYSQDWHPDATEHFDKWPKHCVAGTPGAELHPDLKIPASAQMIHKGMSSADDGYSAFGGLVGNKTFAEVLNDIGPDIIFVCGLATEFCVMETVKSLIEEGYGVACSLDGVRGVTREEEIKAFLMMQGNGVSFFTQEVE